MKILLVSPHMGSRFQIRLPLSISYLSAALKANGYDDISMYDASLEDADPLKATFDAVDLDTNIICIQVYTGMHQWVKEFISICKRHYPNAFIVVGGHHISALKEQAINYLGADCGVVGEGEAILPIIINNLCNGEHISKIINAEPIDVNDIPVPDRDILKPQNYFKTMQSATIPMRGKYPATIMSSRGCPYTCTFCATQGMSGHKFRPRSVDNIIAEIEMLQVKYGVDEILFSDDNLTFDYNRAMSLFNAMIPLGIYWKAPNGIRADRVDYEMAKAMKVSGCYMVGIGVESGNSDVLKRISKHLDLNVVKEAVTIFNSVGIKTSGFFIVGLPNETKAEINDSLKYALSVRFSRIQVGNFIPYPGSVEWDKIFKHDPELIDKFQNTGEIPLFPVLSTNDVYWAQIKMMFLFHLQPRVLWSLLINISLSQVMALFKHPWATMWFDKSKRWFK